MASASHPTRRRSTSRRRRPRAADPRRSSFEYALRAGPPAASEDAPLEVAIALRGESIGTIRAEVPQAPSGWDELDKDVLQSVADEVATALEQIRLLDETQRRAAHRLIRN